MPKSKTPSASGFAAEAARQFSELQSALKAARTSLASLNRTLRVAVPSGGSRTIRGSRSGGLSLGETLGAIALGGALAFEIKDNKDFFDFSGDSTNNSINSSSQNSTFTNSTFYRSASQTAGQILDAALRGQRTR